jgi:N-acetylneuraminic acid mutarotase
MVHSGSRKPSIALLNLASFLFLMNALWLIGCTASTGTVPGPTPTPTPTASPTPTATPTPNPTASNVWTWQGGSNLVNAQGVYGTQGVASATNVPGARNESVRWIDASGNLWLFGGAGLNSSAIASNLNDLWEYNPTAKTWTWVSGSNTFDSIGVYGTQGTPSASNIPGARFGALGWTDSSGNLWLFGGFGRDSTPSNIGFPGFLNDLWKFDPAGKTWTWVSGANTVGSLGVYGTQGVASASNVPRSRSEGVSWIDSTGNLWLFGGFTPDPNVQGDKILNDLWKFSPASGTWTWVSGSNAINAQGVYGTKGVAAASNVPGARLDSVSWIDGTGNLWLFGGQGIDPRLLSGAFNDLWEYSPSTNLWTWVSGSSITQSAGVYGTQGVASLSNIPGARSGSTGWNDNSGNFWLIGGGGFDSTGNVGDINDLWKYNISSDTWTWVGGSNTVSAHGVYGTLGVAAANNIPGAREGSIIWFDSSNNRVWLFGGGGLDSAGTQGNLNDLWSYQP